MASGSSSGGKNHKHGRNKSYCETYRLNRMRERNKIRKLKRLLKRQPNNLTIQPAIDRAEEILRQPIRVKSNT